MPRQINKTNVKKIRSVIRKAGTRGIWIRELARRCGLPIATVHYYLNSIMKEEIETENANIGAFTSSHFKMVKLKR